MRRSEGRRDANVSIRALASACAPDPFGRSGAMFLGTADRAISRGDERGRRTRKTDGDALRKIRAFFTRPAAPTIGVDPIHLRRALCPVGFGRSLLRVTHITVTGTLRCSHECGCDLLEMKNGSKTVPIFERGLLLLGLLLLSIFAFAHAHRFIMFRVEMARFEAR